MISVITPTIRSEGLAIVDKALRRQTYRDIEWLVGSQFKPDHGRWIKDDFKGGYWTLNRIYNKLIKHSRGELIVSWQDFTSSDPDCLEKLWVHYQTEPKTLVTAVGNKYRDDTFMVQTWQDPRERADLGTYYECYPWDIEANLCSIPREALLKVGGFDEQMDFEGYGFDARGVFERLDMIGYQFKIDQTIKSYSLEHGRVSDWDKHNMLNKWFDYKKQQIKSKRYPVLNYL